MNSNPLLAALTIALTATVSVGFASQLAPKVIYGEDNRADVYQVTDAQLLEVADSTVALIAKTDMTQDGTQYKIKAKSFGSTMGLCQDEAFANQPSAANCSGSLIGDDLVMTAGHCIDVNNCSKYNFVFGYKMNSASTANTVLPQTDVYGCKQIMTREYTTKQDYAVIQLDRPVQGRKVLRLSQNPADVGEDIYVVGHPSGLPTKIAGGAKVRSSEKEFFVTNLDTYGGNSGSAVFSAKTHEIIGILVRGAQDFKFDRTNKCYRSNVCEQDGCRGEDVTHVRYVTDYLNK